MKEKEIFAAMVAPLEELLQAYGVTDLPIYKADSTEPQGRVLRAAYLTCITTEPRGWQRQRTRQGETAMVQDQQDTYQVQVTSPNDPANPTQTTAKDLANLLRMLIQSPQYVAALQRVGVGVQRPTPIRPLVFQNEAAQYEAHPSFDFTVSHKTSIILSENEIESFNPGIYGI